MEAALQAQDVETGARCAAHRVGLALRACFTVGYLNSGFVVASSLKILVHPAVIRADDPTALVFQAG